MSSDGAARRYRAWLAPAAVAAAVAAGVLIGTTSDQARIAPGTEVLSLQDDAIRTLSYQTATMSLTARRSASASPFVVDVVYSDGRIEHCASSRDLGGLLPGMLKIVARRQLTQQQAVAEFPVQLGTLVLVDQIAGEPIGPLVVRATRAHSTVALMVQGTAVETTIAPAVFAKLEGACATLATKWCWHPY